MANCETKGQGNTRMAASLLRPLEARREKGLDRKLSLPAGQASVDFCSNDYLGLARSASVSQAVKIELERVEQKYGPSLGSTGSRLLSGNSVYYEEVERLVTSFYGGEAGLLFNSGFDLNLGLMASLPQPGDVVVFDELMHSSVREGLKLSRGTSQLFKHNDVTDLERVLTDLKTSSKVQGNIIVVVESVYSMDGHCAPLVEICDLCDTFNACVVVDEAHGIGVFGPCGKGLVPQLKLEDRVFCRVCTFGKAPGGHGAVLLGPSVLCDYMINYCRPLIYSTSLPTHTLATIKVVHEELERTGDERQAKLRALVDQFCSGLRNEKALLARSLTSSSAIQGFIVPGNRQVVAFCTELCQAGYTVKPIRSPTVPRGTERVRIILHAHNSTEEVAGLLSALITTTIDDEPASVKN
eukprot:CAMPEP_0184512202 /NCGR_PEP_ID=MMETSP0198_2-20121128/2752_1 /TAXON_ID=1112570 /ORGANISM="Thraustochytrium sp., Strain LLF1b" /LENGTH=410 /DNA_ID=CAMNT_0026902205 /DNA_START=72 /DNA_END=1304 /DNA_ORIENTATION=+